jgi:hypothetical protein
MQAKLSFLKFCAGLDVLVPLHTKASVGMPPTLLYAYSIYVYIVGWIHASLALEQLDTIVAFSIQEIICHKSGFRLIRIFQLQK